MCKVLPDHIFDLYIGSFGVTLFFISSGASLMYVYGDELNWKKYLKKRFTGIYPMFWIAFLSATFISFILDGGVREGVPGWKIVYSVFGIDGNTLWWGMNFYRVGEWFLSVIIILYLIFPLLRISVQKTPKLTMTVALMIAGASVMLFRTSMPVDCFAPARIAEFVLGMIMIRYFPKTKTWQFGAGIGMILLAAICNPGRYNAMIQTIIVGFGAYWTLTWIFQRFRMKGMLVRLVEVLAAYSYAFFLTHHYLLELVTARFGGITLGRAEVYLLYAGCFVVVMIASGWLIRAEKDIRGLFRSGKVAVEKQINTDSRK